MTEDGARGAGSHAWPLPRLARFVLLHAGIGWIVAAIFVAALLHSDPGGIGALLTRSQEGYGPLLLLWFFSGLTFGSAQLGAAVMLLGEGGQGPRRGAGGLGLRAPMAPANGRLERLVGMVRLPSSAGPQANPKGRGC